MRIVMGFLKSTEFCLRAIAMSDIPGKGRAPVISSKEYLLSLESYRGLPLSETVVALPLLEAYPEGRTEWGTQWNTGGVFSRNYLSYQS